MNVHRGYYYPGNTSRWVQIAIDESYDIEKILDYVKSRRTVVHAGGNLGIWTRKYAAFFENVYTFEPDTDNFECLKKNISGMRNITYKNAGVGDKATTARVHHAIPGNTGAHQLEEGGDVEVVTIDSLNLDDVDLIQLDVEGYEQKALEGALETIERCKPTIVLELKGVGLKYGYSDAHTKEWLEKLGYCPVARIKNDTVFTHE